VFLSIVYFLCDIPKCASKLVDGIVTWYMRSQVSNINTKIFHALHRNLNVHAVVCLRTVRSKLYLSVSHSDPFFPSLPLLTYLKNLQGELIVQHCILMFHIFNYSGEFPMAVCHWLCHADRPTVVSVSF